MSQTPEVSVIIPVYNGEATLGRCLESVLSQTGVAHEVIVVDDGSRDDTATVLRDFDSRVVVLRNAENMGIAKTYNRGIKKAKAPLLFLIASDCSLMARDHLRRAVGLLKNRPEVGIVTGRPVMPNFDQMEWAPRLFTALNRLEILDPSAGLVEVNFTEARCDMLRRELVQRVGMFNEHLDRSNEDQDLSIKIRRLGFRLLQDNSLQFVMEHGGTSDTFFKLLRKQAQYAKGQAYITVNYGVGDRGPGLWKNPNRRRRAILRSLQTVTVCLFAPSLIATSVMPSAWFAVAALLLWRSCSHGFFTFRRLGLREAAGAVLVGPACDLLYGSAFLIHCTLWIAKGRSALVRMPGWSGEAGLRARPVNGKQDLDRGTNHGPGGLDVPR